MKPCPNCHQSVPFHANLCPNCGCILVASAQTKLITGLPGVDIFLGILAALASPFLAGVGFIVAVVLAFALRPTYTSFARGLLIGVIVWGVLILGALALCFGMIATAPH